jgi:hypothetical protein
LNEITDGYIQMGGWQKQGHVQQKRTANAEIKRLKACNKLIEAGCSELPLCLNIRLKLVDFKFDFSKIPQKIAPQKL